MAYFIRIERKEDLEWLQSILDNSVAKLRQGSTLLEAASEHIARVHESVFAAVPAKEASVLGIDGEFEKEVPPPKKEKEERYKYNHCSDHPYAPIKQAPRTTCKGCWKAYKKLHPEKYDLARRNFLRKQK